MKIFCIGLSKTGNHSLTKALEILGYKTVHYPNNLSEIKDYDAAGDLIVATNYKVLDKKYPYSKFILMTRDAKSWLKSFENHYRHFPIHAIPKYMQKWRVKFWGKNDFDKNTMIRIRKAFHQDVKNYFKNRPGDLLIINIIEGEGWEKLCPFLGKPIPSIPFPKEGVGIYPKNLPKLNLLYNLYRKLKEFLRSFIS